jgi:hypothetical protein
MPESAVQRGQQRLNALSVAEDFCNDATRHTKFLAGLFEIILFELVGQGQEVDLPRFAAVVKVQQAEP